jgi:GH18 family chitinase
MLSCDLKRKKFANNIVSLCKKCNLDGIDLCFQHPIAKQKNNFTDLLKKLKELLSAPHIMPNLNFSSSFDVFKFDNSINPSIMSVTLNASASKAYDIKNITKKVKFINLFSFDMKFSSNGLTDLNHALNMFLHHGAEANKLNIGIVTHECNNSRSITEAATYARYGGFNGIAIHSYDNDDYSESFPLLRAAINAFGSSK